MEVDQRAHINKNLTELADFTFPQTSLFTLLRAKGFYTKEDGERSKSEENMHSQTYRMSKFYELMMTKKGAYEPLMDALKLTRQTGALEILQKLPQSSSGTSPQVGVSTPDGTQRVHTAPSENGGSVISKIGRSKKRISGKTDKPEGPTVKRHRRRICEPDMTEGVANSVDIDPPRAGASGSKNVKRPKEGISPSELKKHLVDKPECTIVKITKQPVYPSLIKDDYKLPADFKGFFLIINIILYIGEDGRKRNGAKQDSLKLKELWTQLGYTGFVFDAADKMYTAKDVRDIVFSFKKYVSKRKCPSIKVFIGGHGALGHIKASDDTKVYIHTDVIYEFSTDNCSKLEKIPKMFYFQCCRGDEKDGNFYKICNAVVCYATLAGNAAARNPNEGSYFVNALVDVTSKNPNNFSYIDILKATHDVLKKQEIIVEDKKGTQIQLSIYEDYEFKNLFFNLND